ncbi:MAG TPA: hypothetical protein PLX89_16790 [Verrucomicrobiota bacterium]|nr:hypothetical protein [Verrucomicrobiales bacterium]HRI14655.1 hypothetical protein [Verrucomicrobiota bacterium]
MSLDEFVVANRTVIEVFSVGCLSAERRHAFLVTERLRELAHQVQRQKRKFLSLIQSMGELRALTQRPLASRIVRRIWREGRRIETLPLRMKQWQRSRPLREFRDRHAGRTAVVVGMGPSLRPTDLDRLGNVVSFACNKIYLAFDEISWRPTYYSVCDILVAENNRDAILGADFGGAQPIHGMLTYDLLKDQDRSLFYNYRGRITDWQIGEPAEMRSDPSHGLYSGGYSVVIDQIQLAYAMGCTQVYLIGVDFFFAGGVATGATSQSGDVLQSLGERNHFHPDYRKPGETWTVPRMAQQAHAFAFCRAAFERSGRKLYNASRQTALTAIERVSFDESFPSPVT